MSAEIVITLTYKMKNLSITLNGILLIAVLVLYILFFTNKRDEPLATETIPSISANIGPGSIAFVEFDSILSNYDMYIALQDVLMDKQSKSEAELNSKSASWEKNASEYQDKMSKGLITRSQAAEVEAQLYQDQQNLLKLRDQMTMELSEEKQVMDRQVMYAILEYLEEYNKAKGFQYVISKSFGGPLLFAESGLDITAEVLAGLNKEYEKSEKDK